MPKPDLRRGATNPKHEQIYQEVLAVFKKYRGNLTAMEILAVMSNMVGKLVAFQDQRIVTPAMAMEIVAANIEEGNKQALAEVQNPRGNA